MISKIKKNPSRKEIRQFGLILIVGFGLIGMFLFWKGIDFVALLLWSASSLVGLFVIAFPGLSKPIYTGWMILGTAIGLVMSKVVMVIIFYLVLTPLALVFKLMGRDELFRSPHNKQSDSYWCDHPPVEKSSYERLF